MATISPAEEGIDVRPFEYAKYSRWTVEFRASKRRNLRLRRGESPAFTTQGPKSLAKAAFRLSSDKVDELRNLAGTDHAGEFGWHWHCACLVNFALSSILIPPADDCTLLSHSTEHDELLRFGRECFSDIQLSQQAWGNEVEFATLRIDLHGSPLLEYLTAYVSEYEATSGFEANWAALFRCFVRNVAEERVVARTRQFNLHLAWLKKAFHFCFVLNEGCSGVRAGALWRVLEPSEGDLEDFLRDANQPVADAREEAQQQQQGLAQPAGGASAGGGADWAGPGAAPAPGAAAFVALAGARAAPGAAEAMAPRASAEAPSGAGVGGQSRDLALDGDEGIDERIERINGSALLSAMAMLEQDSGALIAKYERERGRAADAVTQGREHEQRLVGELQECRDEIARQEEARKKAEENIGKLRKNQEEMAKKLEGGGAGETPDRRRVRDEGGAEGEGGAGGGIRNVRQRLTLQQSLGDGQEGVGEGATQSDSDD